MHWKSNSASEWPAAGHGHIPSLDGLRAVSIILVFLSHAGLSPLIPGGFGVTVFFFLSGFLITTLMIREYNRSGKLDFGAFYLRRVLRLGPSLFLTILLAIILFIGGISPGNLSIEVLFSQFFFIYNYYSLLPSADEGVRGLGILWSLSVEEHFYMIWPLIFLLIARGRINFTHLVFLLTSILLWRVYRFYVWGDNEWTIYISTDTRFDSLLYGCLLALIIARGRLPIWLANNGVLLFFVIASLSLLAATFLWQDPAFRSTFRYSVQGVALMPIFYYAVKRSDYWLFRILNSSVMRLIGVYSYTLYLVHFVILYALWEAGWPDTGPNETIVVAAIISLSWAALVYRFIEQPLHGLRARLAARPAEM